MKNIVIKGMKYLNIIARYMCYKFLPVYDKEIYLTMKDVHIKEMHIGLSQFLCSKRVEIRIEYVVQCRCVRANFEMKRNFEEFRTNIIDDLYSIKLVAKMEHEPLNKIMLKKVFLYNLFPTIKRPHNQELQQSHVTNSQHPVRPWFPINVYWMPPSFIRPSIRAPVVNLLMR